MRHIRLYSFTELDEMMQNKILDDVNTAYKIAEVSRHLITSNAYEILVNCFDAVNAQTRRYSPRIWCFYRYDDDSIFISAVGYYMPDVDGNIEDVISNLRKRISEKELSSYEVALLDEVLSEVKDKAGYEKMLESIMKKVSFEVNKLYKDIIFDRDTRKAVMNGNRETKTFINPEYIGEFTNSGFLFTNEKYR